MYDPENSPWVSNGCEDRIKCSDWKDADMNVAVTCASNLMWYQSERGGRFVHSVIAAAGH